MNVLIVPDKFKGTLTASEAARAIARGWRAARPGDSLELLPMSDGGGGFGLARALGWQFLDRAGDPIERWTDLVRLDRIRPPEQGITFHVPRITHLSRRSRTEADHASRFTFHELLVAADVQNHLLGPR